MMREGYVETSFQDDVFNQFEIVCIVSIFLAVDVVDILKFFSVMHVEKNFQKGRMKIETSVWTTGSIGF